MPLFYWDILYFRDWIEMNQKNPDNILIWIMVNQYLVMNLNFKKKCSWSRSNKWLCGGGLSGISLKGTLQVPNSFWLLMSSMHWYKCFDCVNHTKSRSMEKLLSHNIKTYKKKAANYFFLFILNSYTLHLILI